MPFDPVFQDTPPPEYFYYYPTDLSISFAGIG